MSDTNPASSPSPSPANSGGAAWLGNLNLPAKHMLQAFVERLSYFAASDTAMPWMHQLTVADWRLAVGMKRLHPGVLCDRGTAAVEYLFTPPVFAELFCVGPAGDRLKGLLALRGHLSEQTVHLTPERPMAVVVLAPSLFSDRFELQGA